MNNWFNVKVKYTKQLENGTFKRVSESNLFAAISFTDAEARAFEELGSMIRGEFHVLAITRADFHDIFGIDGCQSWYQVKVQYVSFADDGEKAKKITTKFLVQGNNIDDATKNTNESLSTMMVDYQIISVVESPIIDVFPYKEELDKEISRTPIESVEEDTETHANSEY
jgi:hypothetical protein